MTTVIQTIMIIWNHSIPFHSKMEYAILHFYQFYLLECSYAIREQLLSTVIHTQ